MSAADEVLVRLQVLERILASTQDHLSLVDRDYVYRVVNDAYLEAHVLRRDEIEGRSVAALLGERTFAEVVKPRLDRALAGEVVEFEGTFDFRGKGRRVMTVAYFPYQAPGETSPSGVLVRATDVTRERGFQLDLRVRDEQLALFLDVAKVGTWDWFVDRNELVWSARVLELFGTTREEFGGTYESFLELVLPPDRPILDGRVRQALEDPSFGDRYEAEYRVRRPDGDLRWQSARGAVLRDPEGRPVRMLGIVSDVTERKSLEAQLSHSQKLDAVGQLAGGVAHDFNNLLTAILGSAVLGTRTSDPEKMVEAFATVQEAARRAATLVRSLLTFARARPTEPRVVDVGELLERLRSVLERSLPESIDFTITQPPAPALVRIDAAQLEQVVLNLVVNARDAMPDGGHLRLVLGREVVGSGGALPPGEYVRLDVVDDGCGIPPELQGRIFEPFFSTKPPGAGSGLGLASSHGVVERADGSIRVTSAEGEGTTMTVLLPCAAEGHPREPLSGVSKPPHGRGEVVALVEDDLAVRTTVRQMLESLDYEVLCFGDPAEAAAVLSTRDGPLHLLLTDVVMPDLPGPVLARRLRATRPTLPVVFMSGHARHMEEGPTPGSLMLDKPFTLQELADTLREALRPRREAAGA